MTLHKFEKLGYYKKVRAEGVRHFFGRPSELFESLADWLADPGRTLVHTKTSEAGENDQALGVFCISCRRQPGGEYLVCLWNQTHDVDDDIGCIQANVAPAAARVVGATAPENTIPGFPSYFLVLPDEAKYITVVPTGRLNGNQGFVKYLRGFLELCPRHTVVEQQTGGDVVPVGWGHDNTVAVKGVRPAVKVSLMRAQGDIQWMRDHLRDLLRVWRKKKLRYSVPQDRSILARLARSAGLAADDVRYQDLKLDYGFECALDIAKFDSILRNEDLNSDEFNDVGFQFRRDKEHIRWVGSTAIKTVISAEVRMTNGLFDLTALAQEVMRFKPALIARAEERSARAEEQAARVAEQTAGTAAEK